VIGPFVFIEVNVESYDSLRRLLGFDQQLPVSRTGPPLLIFCI
jgi:hypothetical protein